MNKKYLYLFMTFLIGIFSFVETAWAAKIINGAGATFPYPIYSKWAHAYAKETGVRLNYQSIGSGGGIRQIKARTVDFGASDAPLSLSELEKAGLVQFPMIIGGIVPVVNLKGIDASKLKLDGKTLADIFLGKVRYWDNQAIKALNQGLNLPHLRITVVHRSDGSGTTWIFSNYLASVSNEWKRKVGAAKALHWPTGVGGKGNEGVAAYVKRIKGAIGYVEFAYAKQNHLSTALLKNRDGQFVSASIKSFQDAAIGADWKHTPGMAVVLVNQLGKSSWPITGASFILMYKKQRNPETAKEVLNFFHHCLTKGQDMAKELLYVPLPDPVAKIVEELWAKEIKYNGKPIWP